jgi:hypothetical protein
VEKHGYIYARIGDIKFIFNPLVWPHLPVSSLFCVIDTRNNNCFDPLIGGFHAPLSDGPAFETIYPKYVVSLKEPCIYDMLNAYILLDGFYMNSTSQIIKLKCMVIVCFSNYTFPTL